MHPKLNLPQVKLRARRSGDVTMVWDRLRRSYIVLTPEEWVRQHLIGYLIESLSIPEPQIVVEYPVNLNGQSQRADIVVLNRQGEPVVVVECKGADIKLSQSTLDQAVRYNSVLRARYLILSNGVTHHAYEQMGEGGEYRTLASLDELEF